MASKTEKRQCIAKTKGGLGARCVKDALAGKVCCVIHKSQEPNDNNTEINTEKNTKTINNNNFNNSNTTSKANSDAGAERKIFTIPKEDKSSTTICGTLNAKKEACTVRAKFQCGAGCTNCESALMCLRCWKKAHPTEQAEEKVKKSRTVNEETQCTHNNKTGLKARCKFNGYGNDANGNWACHKHGGPVKPAGAKASSGRAANAAVTTLISSSDIPFQRIWIIRMNLGQKILEAGDIPEDTEDDLYRLDASLKWLDQYIDITGQAVPTQQSILDHLTALHTYADVELVQTLVDNFGIDNMQWLFNHLDRYSSVTNPNGNGISELWTIIAKQYGLELKEKVPEATKIESAKTSANRSAGNNLLDKYKKDKIKETETKEPAKVQNKTFDLMNKLAASNKKAVIVEEEDEEDDMEDSIDEEEAGIVVEDN